MERETSNLILNEKTVIGKLSSSFLTLLVALAGMFPIITFGAINIGAPDQTEAPNTGGGVHDVLIAGSLDGVGPLNGIDWQVDMPWRMEPVQTLLQTARKSARKGGVIVNTLFSKALVGESPELAPAKLDAYITRYDPIPITFTINDVEQQSVTRTKLSLSQFCGMYVIEFQPGKTEPEFSFIPPKLFYEIEASKHWSNEGRIAQPIGKSHQIWKGGQIPGELLNIGKWAAWNATFYYVPVGGTPKGKDLRIIAAARVSLDSDCTEHEYSAGEILFELHRGEGFVSIDALNNQDSMFFGDFLRTHYASNPLPTFGSEWAYGDLHYHSQGTDNEGESGTSYRSALASMKALGLDYAFATEHASDSPQLSGLGRIRITDLPSVGFIEEIPGLNVLVKKAKAIVIKIFNGYLPSIQPEHAVLRDMSSDKFDHLQSWLQDTGGANDEVGSRPGSNRLPQIFLGGEVDVIPEISSESAKNGSYNYGSGRSYRWTDACIEIPNEVSSFTNIKNNCLKNGLQVENGNDGRVSLKDIQGGEFSFYARQHLLYLPNRRDDLPGVNKSVFLSGRTSQYGGATKHLDDILDYVSNDDLGYIFLAHPVAAASGLSLGRFLGPDLYPYSKAQLEVAFASPAVLGLQIWNENARHHSFSTDGHWKFPFLHEQKIDTYNGKLLVTLLDELRPLDYDDADGYNWQALVHLGISEELASWIKRSPQITTLRQLKRAIKSGGGVITYDWSQLDWRWQILNDASVRSSLIDGTAMLDLVNLWGITPERASTVIGLANGKPRKFFMAGGSDAHGDLNYRREGYVLGWSNANDTAIGSPRNLTFVGSDKGGEANGQSTLGQGQVLKGLQSGRFSITDGPAFRIAIDVNSNGIIDDQDIHMGEDTTMVESQGVKVPRFNKALQPSVISSKIKVILEWKSTPEWGPVEKIHLFVGVQAGSHSGLVYQYSRLCLTSKRIKDSDGHEYCPMADDMYVKAPGTKLSINVPHSEGLSGRRTIQLDAFDYKLFEKICNRIPSEIKLMKNPNGGLHGNNEVLSPTFPPPANLYHCTAGNIENPERMFIRAVATTQDDTNPSVVLKDNNLQRFAYSNPVWIQDIPNASQVAPDITSRNTSK